MNTNNDVFKRYFGHSLKKITPINVSYCNQLWEIQLESKKFIIKKYNPTLINNFYVSLDVQNFLSQFDLSPRIEEISFQDDIINKYSIQDYIHPSEILNESLHYLLGKNLSTLHDKLKKCKIKTKKVINDTNLTCIAKNQYSKYLYKLKIKILKKLKNFDESLVSENMQIIHGDYSIKNLIFSKYGIKTIDFDECKTYLKSYEIAKQIINILIKNKCYGIDIVLKNISDFLAGYMNDGVINEQDFNQMFNLYAYTIACNQTGLTEKNNAFKDYDMFLKSRIHLHEFVLDEYESIKKILSKNKNIYYERKVRSSI